MFAIFAQGLDAVPAPFLKNALALLLAFFVGAGGWAALMAYLKRKEKPEREKERAGADRVTDVRRDLFELEIGLVKSKLGEHSVEIGKLWEVMREEDKQIRETLSRAIRDFEGATERLEGTLSEVKALAQKLLEKALD
jgi:hypothetical protein